MRLYIINMNKLIASLVISGLVAFSAFADSGSNQCDDTDFNVADGFAAAGDIIFVRPLAAAATVGGFGIFAVASPFAAMADAVPAVYDTLVEKPGKFAFDRDLGDFSR